MIKAFEYTFELGWKLLKDILLERGYTGTLYGSKDTIRGAFQSGLITNGDVWMNMIEDRNSSVHSYDVETAERILLHIKNDFFIQYLQLEHTVNNLREI